MKKSRKELTSWLRSSNRVLVGREGRFVKKSASYDGGRSWSAPSVKEYENEEVASMAYEQEIGKQRGQGYV